MTEFVEMPLLPASDKKYGGRFCYFTAGSVKSAFEVAASRLEGKAGTRGTFVSSAMGEFQGHFSRVFSQNAAVAASDAAALAQALRTVAGLVGQLVEAAREEDARREQNNAWVREHNERNWLEQRWDDIVGEKARPNAEPGTAPQFPSPAPVTRPRENPPKGGGFGGGTSSARPESLEVFAANSRALDQDLAGTPGALTSELDSFGTNCSWGNIDAEGVLSAYKQFLAANEADAAWALTVAASFAAAGGSGAVSTLSDAAINEALAAAGAGAGRTSLVIPPPLAAGAIPTSGYANDPVNTATGNFIEPETDLGFTGSASNLVFTRMYNSMGSGLESPGVFGPGWASILDQHLDVSDDGARWVMADGRAVDFPRAGSGWGRGVGENLWLSTEPLNSPSFTELNELHTTGTSPTTADSTDTRAGDDIAGEGMGLSSVLVVRDNTGGWWAFTTAGAWLGTGCGVGRTIGVVRDQNSLITSLEHGCGRGIRVSYDSGVVASITASDGRCVDYGYSDVGQLVTVASSSGVREYRWNSAGFISAVVAATGVVEAANEYDATGRVVVQVTEHGRRTRFAYLPGRVTVVSDEDGTNSNTWIADAKGRLVGVVDSDDQRQSMAYDGQGNLVSFTERDGSVTVHGYDGRGRRIRTLTADGADLTYGYDEYDRVTTLVTESGSVIEYEYADDLSRDPSRVRDPLGGDTFLTWSNGVLESVVDPVGVALRFEYDSFGELVATRNAVGDTSHIIRDRAGRPVQTITPAGAVTGYQYNAAGILVAREEPDGSRWLFGHDAAGRVTKITDPLGAVTVLEYAGNGELVRTTDPLGRVVERVFDEWGNVIAAILPDGARWGFTHDSLSRLTQVTDPAGQGWKRHYNTLGELVAVIDPTGVRAASSTNRPARTTSLETSVASVTEAFSGVSVRFDEYGRPVSCTAEDGSEELITYNAAGQPVEFLDGEGALTRLTRDIAGRVTAVTTPTGATTTYNYDQCGRPSTTVDGLGHTTELRYDADQRITTRIHHSVDHAATGNTRDRSISGTGSSGAEELACVGAGCAGVVESLSYDVMGRVTTRRSNSGLGSTGGVTSRFGYDCVGRVTFSQDPWSGTRRFAYNLAGELISTTNGVGGKTRFHYDTRGRLVKVIDPVGGVTTRTYTELDKVASTTDPLGRVTQASYDAAGRQLSQTDPDGRVTSWAFNAQGREESMAVDGKLVSQITRNPRERTVTILDSSSPDGVPAEHVLCYNRRGQLTQKTRTIDHGTGQGAGGTSQLSWGYDADGQQSSFTTTDGTTTYYHRNAVGHITKVTNPLLGEATLERDSAGNLTHTTTTPPEKTGGVGGVGALVQHWSYRGGFLAEHTRTTTAAGHSSRVSDSTLLTHDSDGRISTLLRGQELHRYAYDGAGQLISVTTTALHKNSDPGSGSDADGGEVSADVVTRWVYDQGGRLVEEATPAGTIRYVYDAAGQLLASIGVDDSRTDYVYDGLGHRVRVSGPDGGSTEYAWGVTGYLASTLTRSPDGSVTDGHQLWVDSLGELASVDGVDIHWDSAAPFPTLAGVGEDQVLNLPGGITGIGGQWETPTWRMARATSPADPWALIHTTTNQDNQSSETGMSGEPNQSGDTGHDGHDGLTSAGLPAGVGLGASGGLAVAGLEWLGARAYDPGTRGFLSTDPLSPVLGAGWDGNPYSYAGNNPLAATDPTGLRPLTDADLSAYDGSSRGAFAAVADWTKNNWEYLAGGAAIVAGGVLLATGVGGPAGVMLIAAGADTIIQKATTGEVNWGEVALSGALGGFGGASIAAKAGLTGIKGVMVAGGSSGGISGGIQGAYSYYSGPGPHTVGGGLQATAASTAAGTVMGVGGGVAGAKIGQKAMGLITVRPQAETVVMGRWMEGRVTPYANEFGHGYYSGTPDWIHDPMESWVKQATPNSKTEALLVRAQKFVDEGFNTAWINTQLNAGRKIVDIGVDLEGSAFYQLERNAVSNYPNYLQDFQRNSDLRIPLGSN